VGSAPADKRKSTGSILELLCQIVSIGYEIGAVKS